MPSVKNINGTTDKNCRCHSWLKHWEKYSKKTVYFCAAYGCTEKDHLVGTHVQKATTDEDWYIIPFCPTHSKAKGELKISAFTMFISANTKDTCGKSTVKHQSHDKEQSQTLTC